MRDHIYRAWDAGNKVMHFNVQFLQSGYDGNDWICFESDQRKRVCTNNNIVMYEPFFRHQIKVMEFTGFFDKNGDPIYEGDMVLCSNKTTYVVKFGTYCNMNMEYDDLVVGFYLDPNGALDDTNFPIRGESFGPSKANTNICDYATVLGNIYQGKLK